ncbi:MAG: hypothetical protein C5B43_00075 [Verrucomicrobia bacterium]|nr:MAG: hypothetical protein C5B43_00075 [Verrucomicrobiota bacterium]
MKFIVYLVAVFLCNSLLSGNFINDLRNGICVLPSAKYVEVDLAINGELLDTFSIDHAKSISFAYQGNDIELKSTLVNFLSGISSTEKSIINNLADLLTERLNDIYIVQEKPYLWVFVSSTMTKDMNYKWHTDLSFEKEASAGSAKLGREIEYLGRQDCAHDYFVLMTLKGPATQFYDGILIPSKREEFAQCLCRENFTAIHHLLDSDYFNSGKTGSAYILLNGMWDGCIHSAPPKIDEERLLIAVGGASEKAKQYLEQKFKK